MLEENTLYINGSIMIIILFLSPTLTARLLSATPPKLDLENLPIPKRWWMICLTALCQIILTTVDLSLYSNDLGQIQILPKLVGVLSLVPELCLTIIYCVVQTTTILLTNSLLTLLIKEFDDVVVQDIKIESFNNVCENFELIEEHLALLYLLFFSTASINVSISAFLLYFYYQSESVPALINCTFYVISGIAILFHFALIAEDCYESMRKLHLRLR